jgi:hypothetical protein
MIISIGQCCTNKRANGLNQNVEAQTLEYCNARLAQSYNN